MIVALLIAARAFLDAESGQIVLRIELHPTKPAPKRDLAL